MLRSRGIPRIETFHHGAAAIMRTGRCKDQVDSDGGAGSVGHDRTSARRRGSRFDGSDGGTHELAIDPRCNCVNVNVLSGEKLPSIFNAVDPRRPEFNLLESRRGEFCLVLVLLHDTCNATNPEKNVLANLRQNQATSDDIRHREAACWLQDPECFSENALLISRKIDDAIGDDDIDRSVWQWNVFNLSLTPRLECGAHYRRQDRMA
jgi:hypothetical protein